MRIESPRSGVIGDRLRGMVISQADMCDPGWSELMLAMARRSVSCSRSFAVDVAEAEHPGGLGVDDQLELG
jgi:hypothetical protein